MIVLQRLKSYMQYHTTVVAGISLVLLAALVVFTLTIGAKPDTRKNNNARAGNATFSLEAPQPAPEIKGISTWINSEPVTIESLKGKVVLVDFWTYSCINCIRNNPYIQEWYEKYKDDGLVVIGIHAPEFAFERNPDNVRKAVKEMGLTYPIAMDNDMTTWDAFSNRSWPAGYFIDRSGNIRHTHFGEGEYENSEKVIQTLLTEINPNFSADLETDAKDPPIDRRQTPETYLSFTRGQNFLNATEFKEGQTTNYSGAFQPLSPSEWSLSGAWEVGPESSFTKADNVKLSLNFTAKELYLVMGSARPAVGKITVDGAISNLGQDVSAEGIVNIGEYRLYKLVKSDESLKNKIFEITLPAGVEAHAFTFGS